MPRDVVPPRNDRPADRTTRAGRKRPIGAAARRCSRSETLIPARQIVDLSRVASLRRRAGFTAAHWMIQKARRYESLMQEDDVAWCPTKGLAAEPVSEKTISRRRDAGPTGLASEESTVDAAKTRDGSR